MADMLVFARTERIGRVLVTSPSRLCRAGSLPTQDYDGKRIDPNDIVILDATSTYVVRVTGDSMEGAGIAHGDEVIVDRALTPRDGNVVIAIVGGELSIKRIRIRSDGTWLVLENRKYAAQRLDEHAELTVWSVVTRSLHVVSHR